MSTLMSFAAGSLLAAPLPSGAPAPAAGADPFWQRFLTSAGFGGLTALTAALIAARVAAKQLQHTKAQQRNERWWTTLTWVYDRAVVEKDKRAALPHQVTFAMLTELAERARVPPDDRLQQSSIKSILSMFEASDDVHQLPDRSADHGTANDRASRDDAGSSSSIIQVSDPTAAALLEELRDRLSSDSELRARADQLQYLHAAKMAVEREAAALGADTGVVDSGRRANIAVSWQGREVLVRIRYSEERISNATVLQSIEQLQREISASYSAVGGLIIFSTPFSAAAVDSFMAPARRPAIEVATWTATADDGLIHDALRRLRPPNTTENS